LKSIIKIQNIGLKYALTSKHNMFSSSDNYWIFIIGAIKPLPDAVRKQKKKDLFSSVLSHFKKYHPSGNMNFNNLGLFQSLKLRISMEKVLPISLIFTPNILGCYTSM